MLLDLKYNLSAEGISCITCSGENAGPQTMVGAAQPGLSPGLEELKCEADNYNVQISHWTLDGPCGKEAHIGNGMVELPVGMEYLEKYFLL